MKAIGIDLGISNAVAAVAEDKTTVLRNRDGSTTTPVVVSLGPPSMGGILIGSRAVRHASRDPENTVSAITRLLGCSRDDAQMEVARRHHYYRIAEPLPAATAEPSVSVLLGDQAYTPVEITAMILNQVREDAEQALNESVTHAVISVPAHYTDRQREATREAGELAGITVISLIDDPVAATMAGGIEGDQRDLTLVYDLGGGSFSVAIVAVDSGDCQVRFVGGDAWLGGDDFDRAIVQRMVNWVAREYAVDLSDDRVFLARAKAEAERAKISLSQNESVRIVVPSIAKLPNPGPVNIDMQVSRAEFESDIRPLVDRTIQYVRQTLAQQSRCADDVTKVLMVGGSTRIPLVQRAIEAEFGQDRIQRRVEPTESVALGAALAAARVDLEDRDVNAPIDSQNVDRTPRSASQLRSQGSNTVGPMPELDENVQFTVYRPKSVRPGKWYPLIAFAHLDELADDAEEDEPDPVEEVKRQAEAVLGPKIREYKQTVQDSKQAVPKAGELRFVPEVEGCEFNPPQVLIRWIESVHKAEFRVRADVSLDGKSVRGRMSVFLGAILLADVPIRFKVSSSLIEGAQEQPTETSSAKPYRKIFASYSHKDLAIVEQFERYAETLGDRYLRDWKELRSGENWDDRLLELIEEADVFQLFWSNNSMRSAFVRREWEHAISLTNKGPYFVRPTYWETPLPQIPEDNLPPAELHRRHFTCLATPETTASTPQRENETRYYIRRREQVLGPYERSALDKLPRLGRISPHVEVSRDGVNWERVTDHPELFPGVKPLTFPKPDTDTGGVGSSKNLGSRHCDEAAPADDWRDQQERLEQEDADYNAAVDALRGGLDDSASFAELESLYCTLQRFDREIDPVLTNRVQERFTAYCDMARRRSRLTVVGSVVLVLLCISVPSFAIYAYSRASFVDTQVSTLRQLVETKDIATAEAFLEQLKRTAPNVFAEPEIQELVVETRRLQAQRDAQLHSPREPESGDM